MDTALKASKICGKYDRELKEYTFKFFLDGDIGSLLGMKEVYEKMRDDSEDPARYEGIIGKLLNIYCTYMAAPEEVRDDALKAVTEMVVDDCFRAVVRKYIPQIISMAVKKSLNDIQDIRNIV